MGKKRKKKARGTRKSPQKIPILLGAFFFLGIVIAFLVYSFFLPATPKQSRPYEELHTRPSSIVIQITKIDQAIFECLQKNRIPKKNILFVGVKEKREKGMSWDFTDLLMKVPQGTSFEKVGQSLAKTLSSLRPVVTYRDESASEHEKTYHVYALGFYTHKIRLASEGTRGEWRKEVAKIAILIDDVGYDFDMARSFMQMGFAITLSVLPEAPYTDSIIQKAREEGHEFMLHLPMEPKDYPHVDPGPGALFSAMGDEEIRKVFNDHLKRVPGARGVNNHMGSAFTEHEDKMQVLLQEMKRQGLFYVDSRTTSETAAPRIAGFIGVPLASRTVFLDNDLSPRAMEFQMGRLIAVARETGAAIGIAHPHMETLNFLKKHLHEVTSEAKVVPVSQIVG